MSAPAEAPGGALEIVRFEIEGARFAVAAADLDEVVRAASVAPLPGAPAVVLGVLDVRGVLVPVFDLGARLLGLPPRALRPSEHFLLARAAGRRVALRVDAVLGLARLEEGALESAAGLAPAAPHVAGIARDRDGLLVVHDLAAFLSDAEAAGVDAALAALEHAPA